MRNERGGAEEQLQRCSRRVWFGAWVGGGLWGWMGGLKPEDEEAVLTREVVEEVVIWMNGGCVLDWEERDGCLKVWCFGVSVT